MCFQLAQLSSFYSSSEMYHYHQPLRLKCSWWWKNLCQTEFHDNKDVDHLAERWPSSSPRWSHVMVTHTFHFIWNICHKLERMVQNTFDSRHCIECLVWPVLTRCWQHGAVGRQEIRLMYVTQKLFVCCPSLTGTQWRPGTFNNGLLAVLSCQLSITGSGTNFAADTN